MPDSSHETMPPPERSLIRRRTAVAAAAWSVPAIVAITATPAAALSGNQVSVTTANNQIPAAGATTVSAKVTDSSGAPLSGRAVTFQAPTGASVSSSSATTGSNGIATTNVDLQTRWAKPGSMVTVSAIVDGAITSTALTVLGSNLIATDPITSTRTLTQTPLVFPSPVRGASAADTTGNGVGISQLVVLEDGQVWGRGANQAGQLGDGTTTSRATWAPVANLTNVTQVVAIPFVAFALRSDGTVWAWGDNSAGRFGDGTTTSSLTPVLASTLPATVVQITARLTTAYARLSDGTLCAWGGSQYGQLGNGSTASTASAVTVLAADGAAGVLGSVVDIASGYASAMARTSSGAVVAWGWNKSGQLGIGSTTDMSRPVTVAALANARQIAVGPQNGYALSSSGAALGWGENSNGAVGDGTTVTRLSPVSVSGLGSGVAELTAIDRYEANRGAAYARMTDGSLRSWGYNGFGELADGTTLSRSYQVTPATPAGSPSVDRVWTTQASVSMVTLKTS